MSLNLLASYGSDESGNSDDEDFGKTANEEKEEEEEQPEGNEAPATSSAGQEKKSFFSSDFASSDEDEDEEEDEPEPAAPEVPRLPSARSILSGAAKLESSLFISEAEKEQHESDMLLSQHVPVSEQVKKEQRTFRGKRKAVPCKAFLRGSCPRGARCRYAHLIPDSGTGDAVQTTIESKAQFYSDPNEVFVKKAKLNTNEVFAKKSKLK